MISIEEFEDRVAENIKTLNKEIVEKSFTPSNYHYYQKDRSEEKRLFEFENAWDIIGATLVGDLPSNNPDGADGFRLKDGVYIQMEYKISRKKQASIWQTPRGSLNVGRANIKNKFASLRSALAASFEIQNNLFSKDRLTNLFIFDETLQQFVSGFELDGPAIVTYLGRGGGNKRTIKLSHFIIHGIEIPLTVPSYGSYINWESMLRNTVPTLAKGDLRLTS